VDLLPNNSTKTSLFETYYTFLAKDLREVPHFMQGAHSTYLKGMYTIDVLKMCGIAFQR
jgi:hypothetical protein